MSQNEKLGIEINIDLKNAKQQIERLNELLTKLGQSPEAAAKNFEKLTSRIEALGKARGFDPQKVKDLMKAFEDSTSFDKFFKNLSKFGEGTAQVLNAEKAMIRQRNKDLEIADKERMVLIRKQNQQELEERKRTIQMLKAQSLDDTRKIQISATSGPADSMVKARNAFILRSQQELAQQIIAIEKNTASSVRRINQEEIENRRRAMQQIQAQAVNQQREWNAIAGTQGVRYQGVNGGFVQSSVQAQNLSSATFARIQAEAIKMNNALRESPTHVNKLNIALGSLATRIAEFYGLRALVLAPYNQISGAISGIIQYKQTVAEIAAITTATKDETKEYAETISKLARTSKFSAVEIAEAMKVVSQSGIQRNELVPVTRAAELLAAATGGSTTASANVVTTTMNVWQVAAERALGITNVLATAVKNSKTNVSDLSTAFNYLATSANQSNMSLEETTATIATLRNKGVQASTVGTGLSQFLKVLEAPTAKVRQFFKELELGPRDVDTKLRSLGDILNTISEAGIKKYGSELALTTRLSEAFEMRTGRTAKALINNGDAIKSMTYAMRNSEAGFLALMRTMEGPQVKINKIKHEFMLFVQLIGDDLSTAISKGTSGLLGFTQGLQEAEIRTNLIGTALAGLALVAVTALASMRTALLSLYTTNPWLLALTVTFGLYATAVIKAAGSLDYINKKWDDALTKQREEAEINQRQSNELNKFIGTLTTVNGHKQTLNDLTIEQRRHLDALKPSMEGMLGDLDSEKSLIEQLLPLMKQFALERGKLLLNQADTFNSMKFAVDTDEYNLKLAESRAAALEKKVGLVGKVLADNLLKEDKKAAKDRDASDPLRVSRSMVERYGVTDPEKAVGITDTVKLTWYQEMAQDLRSHINKYKPKLETAALALGDAPRDNNGYVDVKLFAASVASIEESEEKKRKLGNYTGRDQFPADVKADAKAEESKEVRDRNFKEALLQEKQKQTSERANLARQRYEDAKLDLKETKDLAKFKSQAEIAINAEYDQKEQEALMQANKDAADRVKGVLELVFDEAGAVDWSKTKIRGGEKYEGAQVTKSAEEAQKTATAALDTLKQERANALKKLNTVQTKEPAIETAKQEKQLAFELKAAQQTASLQREEAYSASRLQEIEENLLATTIRIGSEKTKNLHTENETINAWLIQNETVKGLEDKASSLKKIRDENIDRIKQENLLLEEQEAKLKRIKDHTFETNFRRGVGGAWAGLSNTDSLSQGLGADLTNSAFNGITGTLSSTLSTFTLPDQDAIDGIKSKINELNVQKAQIQASISSITSKGEFMTGADKSALNEQASGLDAVNASLREQEKLLDKQNNAWSRFKDGLAETMKQILKTLQEYIIKLMVVKMVESVISAFSGGGGSSPEIANAQSNFNLNTGNVAFASGGLVPNSIGTPGKDSVPAWLMPGEFIIPTEKVNKYGAAHFEKYRAGKFAEGGLVGGSSRPTTSSSEGKSVQNLQIVNIVDPSQIPQTTDDQIINVISYDMARKGQTYRAVRQVAAG